MDITGRRIVPGGRGDVWGHLTNAESLRLCIPGCESVVGSADDGFDMVVGRKVGPFNLQFSGSIELADAVPARSVTLIGRGKGGVAGLAQGSAQIRLTDHADGTEIAWDLATSLEGRLARLGRTPIENAVTTMTDRFADRLSALLRGEDVDTA